MNKPKKNDTVPPKGSPCESATLEASATTSSKHQTAVTEIRNRILRGDYTTRDENSDRRQIMVEGKDGLAEELKLGAVSIRRALVELQIEGLVSIEPHSGSYVKTVGDEELRQLWRTRTALEEFFVTTIARSLTSTESSKKLGEASEINQKLAKLIRKDFSSEYSSSLANKVIQFDVDFHNKIADAAGFPLLHEELVRVRNRIRLGAGPAKMTTEYLRQVVADHETILETLKPRKGTWIADVVEARLAMTSHLRKAAMRLQLTHRIRPTSNSMNDPVWDLPSTVATDRKRRSAMFMFRILCEVLAASLLSEQDVQHRLQLPTAICTQMSEIARECAEHISGAISPDLRARFISLDIQFHCTLAYISGLTFLSEAVQYSWHNIHDDATRNLDAKRMATVAAEHQKILNALLYFAANSDEPGGESEIIKLLIAHLTGAAKYMPADDDCSVNEELVQWFVDKCTSHRAK